MPTPIEIPIVLQTPFDRLRHAFAEHGGLTYGERSRYLSALQDTIRDRQDDIVAAIDADFGCRSKYETLLGELMLVVNSIKTTRKRMKGWMKPRRRHISWLFMPAHNRVHYQPLGVVGIIAPWNYPFLLAVEPLVGAISAGNRVLIKPSEFTPKTSEVLVDLLGAVFPADVVAVVTGDAAIGAAFSSLPFDHLLFTGSTQVGRRVMRAAAENLTPVTLELGGKSPTLFHDSYPIEKGCEAFLGGKLFNSGQTCIAPDYLLVPKGKERAYADAITAVVSKRYPRILDNPDYTSIVNERHRRRLQGYLKEAKELGATAMVINPANETFDDDSIKMPLTLLLDVTDEMTVMQDEIFGPILPIVGYETLEAALQFNNDRPRPLALCYFDNDPSRVRRVLERTVSGGVCINSTIMHVAQDDLPFGGVGASGLGAYHGREGFETFSHAKGVFFQSRLNASALLNPPYTSSLDTILNVTIGKLKK